MTEPVTKHVSPETLDAKKFPCPCVQHHEPQVTRTQSHHVLPLYAGGQTTDKKGLGYTPKQPLCPTAHDEVHILLEEWAVLEGTAFDTHDTFDPPSAGHRNHVIHTIALRGWQLFHQYWPDQPFPRENAPKPSG